MNQPNARVIPVDHRNLRAFYSRGMLTPASLVRRYKLDALAWSPERLPVFPGSDGAGSRDRRGRRRGDNGSPRGQ